MLQMFKEVLNQISKTNTTKRTLLFGLILLMGQAVWLMVTPSTWLALSELLWKIDLF